MKWLTEGTTHEEEVTETGWRRLSMANAKDKALAGKKIVFVDDDGLMHDDINTLAAAKKADLLEKEPFLPKGKPALTSEGLIEYTLILPAAAFTLFDMVKSFGLVKDGDMTFDQWVYECIDRRFTADYNVEIVLQPIAAKRGDIKEMVKEAAREAAREAAKEILGEKEQ